MGDNRETNGLTNGHVNGYANGRTNGYTDGQRANGYTNGNTNGQTNGSSNGGGLWTSKRAPSEWFIGSIDQGTTSSRFLIFNRHMDPVASHQIEFENLYPESGY